MIQFKKVFLLSELSKKYYDFVKKNMNAEKFPFNDLFGDKLRIVEPLGKTRSHESVETQRKIYEIVEMVRVYLNLDFKVDFDTWVVYKTKDSTKKNPIRIGKFLSSALTSLEKILKSIPEATQKRIVVQNELKELEKQKKDLQKKLVGSYISAGDDERDQQMSVSEQLTQLNQKIIPLEKELRLLNVKLNDPEEIKQSVAKISELLKYSDLRKKFEMEEQSSEFSVIFSRSPIDVIRMSDHGWASCHSENPGGADYFTCAIADAIHEGAIAYLVKTSDLENISDFQQEEIFSDSKRVVQGIRPLARIRIRLLTDARGNEIAVPVNNLYSENEYTHIKQPFMTKVIEFCRRQKSDSFVLNKTLVLMGGSYQDTSLTEDLKLVYPERADEIDSASIEYATSEEKYKGVRLRDQITPHDFLEQHLEKWNKEIRNEIVQELFSGDTPPSLSFTLDTHYNRSWTINITTPVFIQIFQELGKINWYKNLSDDISLHYDQGNAYLEIDISLQNINPVFFLEEDDIHGWVLNREKYKTFVKRELFKIENFFGKIDKHFDDKIIRYVIQSEDGDDEMIEKYILKQDKFEQYRQEIISLLNVFEQRKKTIFNYRLTSKEDRDEIYDWNFSDAKFIERFDSHDIQVRRELLEKIKEKYDISEAMNDFELIRFLKNLTNRTVVVLLARRQITSSYANTYRLPNDRRVSLQAIEWEVDISPHVEYRLLSEKSISEIAFNLVKFFPHLLEDIVKVLKFFKEHEKITGVSLMKFSVGEKKDNNINNGMNTFDKLCRDILQEIDYSKGGVSNQSGANFAPKVAPGQMNASQSGTGAQMKFAGNPKFQNPSVQPQQQQVDPEEIEEFNTNAGLRQSNPTAFQNYVNTVVKDPNKFNRFLDHLVNTSQQVPGITK